MKRMFIYLHVLGILCACKTPNIEDIHLNKYEEDTTRIIADNDSLIQNNDSSVRTQIDSSECYMLQEWNELGEPVNSYGCMRFDRNAGYTFADAYTSIKTEIDSLVNKNIIEEKRSGNSYADKWELRQVIRDVTNSPNEKLVYKSLELYMYSNIWCAYIIVSQYCIIDSEGNIYYFITPAD